MSAPEDCRCDGHRCPRSLPVYPSLSFDEKKSWWRDSKPSKQDRESRRAERREFEASARHWSRHNAEVVRAALASTPITCRVRLDHVLDRSYWEPGYYTSTPTRGSLFEQPAPESPTAPSPRRSKSRNRAPVDQASTTDGVMCVFEPWFTERIEWEPLAEPFNAVVFAVQNVQNRHLTRAEHSARVAKGGSDEFRWFKLGEPWYSILHWNPDDPSKWTERFCSDHNLLLRALSEMTVRAAADGEIVTVTRATPLSGRCQLIFFFRRPHH